MNLSFTFSKIEHELLHCQLSTYSIANEIMLNCFIQGGHVFPVDITPRRNVGHLKKLIFAEKPKTFEDMEADELDLWHVNVPANNIYNISTANGIELSNVTCPLSEVFEAGHNP